MESNQPEEEEIIMQYEQGADHDVARARRDHETLAKGGFGPLRTVVPFGTRVTTDGCERERQSFADWEAMPPGHEVLDEAETLIEREERVNAAPAHVKGRVSGVPLTRMLAMPDGTWGPGTGMPAPDKSAFLTDHALKQLLNFTQGVPRAAKRGEDLTEVGAQRMFPHGAVSYVLSDKLTAQDRADELNKWLRRGHLTKPGSPGEPLLMSTRRGDIVVEEPAWFRAQIRNRNRESGGRETFAVLGPRWNTGADLNQFAQMLRPHLVPGARGRTRYDRATTRWSIELLHHTVLQPGESPVAGEIFKGGMIVKSADNGTCGPQIKAEVWANLCLNFMIIGSSTAVDVRTTHARQDMTGWIGAQINAVNTALGGFAQQWGDAYKTRLLGRDWDSPSEAFNKLIDLSYIKVPDGSGLSRKEYGDRLTANYYRAKDSGQVPPGGYISVACAVNAVTRNHEYAWANQWTVEEEAEQGGQLLYNVRAYRS